MGQYGRNSTLPTAYTPMWTQFLVGNCNGKREPVVEPKAILILPLHIKLGLMKEFVKAPKQDSEAVQYLQIVSRIYPKPSESKFYPQIKKEIRWWWIHSYSNTREKQATSGLKAHGFPGNNNAENYKEFIETTLESF